MTEAGETTNFKISDHVREIVKYLKVDCLDYILCSSTKFSPHALKAYASQNQVPVVERSLDKIKKFTKARVIFADVASESVLVRHDSLKLASALKKLLQVK